ncbi:hypothetical protein B0J17DRAFT_770990 [Rhizoctonia solani]|nr:hypothetical protein B0J17DRAFT_770990 [Rhizoctonia solani]
MRTFITTNNMENHRTYVTIDTELCAQCSVSAPIMSSNLSVQTTGIDALAGHYNLLLPEHDPETDGSSQEEDPTSTPHAVKHSGGVPFEWEEAKPLTSSTPPNNCCAAKHDEITRQNPGLRTVCSRSYGSGQYFKLAHEYAESARAVAQLKLTRMVASFEYNTVSYPTHFLYDTWATTMDGQRYYMHAQDYSHLSGTLEVEIGNELGWSSGTWNIYSLGELGEVERFYSTE